VTRLRKDEERGVTPSMKAVLSVVLTIAAATAPAIAGELYSRGGLWWDPARPAQGFMIEELSQERLAVTWYTWAPQADPEPGPRWFHGVGRIEQGHAAIDLLEVRGGRFGVSLDPAQLSYVPWGRIEIDFADQRATLDYAGPGAYGQGRQALQRLVKAGTGLGPGIAFSPPLSFDFERTGTYYDPAHPAGGWVLNQYEQDGQEHSLLLWFTWDSNGRPIWLHGIDTDDGDGLFFRMRWATAGGRFEPGYALDDVQLREWGDVGLQGTTCSDGRITQVDWRADTHGFGDGHIPVARLTQPVILHVAANCPAR
jgi:hypothetical protein